MESKIKEWEATLNKLTEKIMGGRVRRKEVAEKDQCHPICVFLSFIHSLKKAGHKCSVCDKELEKINWNNITNKGGVK